MSLVRIYLAIRCFLLIIDKHPLPRGYFSFRSEFFFFINISFKTAHRNVPFICRNLLSTIKRDEYIEEILLLLRLNSSTEISICNLTNIRVHNSFELQRRAGVRSEFLEIRIFEHRVHRRENSPKKRSGKGSARNETITT